MTKRRRILRITKWGAGILSLLFVALWLASVFGEIEVPLGPRNLRNPRINGYSIVISSGVFRLIDQWRLLGPLYSPRPFEWRRLGLNVLPATGQPRRPAKYDVVIPRRWFQVPFWLPSAIAISIYAALFILDRRKPAVGFCECGYNLTGNLSGRCPECGEPCGASN